MEMADRYEKVYVILICKGGKAPQMYGHYAYEYEADAWKVVEMLQEEGQLLREDWAAVEELSFIEHFAFKRMAMHVA